MFQADPEFPNPTDPSVQDLRDALEAAQRTQEQLRLENERLRSNLESVTRQMEEERAQHAQESKQIQLERLGMPTQAATR